MRIAFGLSQTLIDVEEVGLDFSVKLRPGVVELLTILKEQKHTLILWTSRCQSNFKNIQRKSKELFEFFDEIYCKEDFDLLEDIPGCSIHVFKNINKINADCMIESKMSYKKYSNILHIGNKYLILDKYREFLLDEPTKWMVKLVGTEVIKKREKRRQEKENWVFDVLEFVERLENSETTKNN